MATTNNVYDLAAISGTDVFITSSPSAYGQTVHVHVSGRDALVDVPDGHADVRHVAQSILISMKALNARHVVYAALRGTVPSRAAREQLTTAVLTRCALDAAGQAAFNAIF